MRVAKLKEAYPTAKVQMWCEDEHRLGIKPILRRAWGPIGQRPPAKVHQRYEWAYLYAFVRPNTGEVYLLLLPTVNAEAFSVALEHFAKKVGAGNRKRILLVLDRAGAGLLATGAFMGAATALSGRVGPRALRVTSHQLSARKLDPLETLSDL